MAAQEMTTLEQHVEAYVALEKDKVEPKQVLKDLAKRQRVHRKFLQTYMEEHGVDEIPLGDLGTTMCRQTASKVKFSEERLVSFLEDPSQVERYKEENTEDRTSFTVKKRKLEED